MRHRNPFFKKLCVTAAGAAAFVPVFAEAAAYQYRANLQGLVVSGPGPSLDNLSVALATSQLPDAIVGVPYSANLNQLLSVTGDAAYSGEGVSWGVVSNSLPAGLYLTVDGYIGGTPTAEGAGAIQVRASYKTANGEQTYQVVSIPLMVSLAAATLPSGMVGQAYTYNLRDHLLVTGDKALDLNQATLTTSDALPAGLSLASTGVLSGTPTVKNTSGTSFQVVASYKTQTGQQVYTLIVNGAVLRATSISMSYSSACAILATGQAKCWGYNNYGQLGHGSPSTPYNPTPGTVQGLNNVSKIYTGRHHSCAVTTAGAAYCWGFNGQGQLGDNSTTNRFTPVAVNGLSADVKSMAVGDNHTCALMASGLVKCWGSGSLGRLGTGNTTNQWAPADTSLTNAAFISSGSRHTCAVTGGGVKCWGDNANGQLGDGTTTVRSLPAQVFGLSSGVASVDVSTTNSHTCALLTDGTVKCWGGNGGGQLGNGGDTNSSVPVTAKDVVGAVAVSVGYMHSCALLNTGAVKCWGTNGDGQLGDGTNSKRVYPVIASAITSSVSALAAGWNANCVVLTSGEVNCWGQGQMGVLGNGTLVTNMAPVEVIP